MQEHNIQILQQSILTIKFELTVRLNNIVQHPFQLAPPIITAQSLPPPFITTEIIYKYDRYRKKTIGYITFITHTQVYHTHVYSKDIHISTLPFAHFFRTKPKSFSSHRTPRSTSNTLRL